MVFALTPQPHMVDRVITDMMNQLQDPTHVVPSIIVGLLLSSGWGVVKNTMGEPFICKSDRPFITYSTWWDCLKDLIDFASNPENIHGN